MGISCSNTQFVNDILLVKSLLRGDLKDAEYAILASANPNFIHKTSCKSLKFRLINGSERNKTYTDEELKRMTEIAPKYVKEVRHVTDTPVQTLSFVINNTINFSTPLHLCASLAIYNEIYSQCFPSRFLFDQDSIERVVSLLIEKGAIVNAIDEHLNTPLHYVSKTSHIGLSKLLVHHGASIDKVNRKGMTPVNTAFALKQFPMYVSLTRADVENPESKCVICTMVDRNTILTPCGHYNFCTKCVIGLADCPICRQKITATNRVYA